MTKFKKAGELSMRGELVSTFLAGDKVLITGESYGLIRVVVLTGESKGEVALIEPEALEF